jgi:hypothetical protein
MTKRTLMTTIGFGTALAFALASCSLGPQRVDQAVNATLTAMAAQATATPIVLLTAAPSSTPIIVATSAPPSTPTTAPVTPSLTPSPTAVVITPPAGDPVLTLGKPDSVDNFDNDNNWPTYPPGDNTCFSSEIKDGKLWMTATGQVQAACWELSWPELDNFYIELTLQMPQSCDASDRFGLLFRAPDNTTGYLYGITCGGVQSFTAWTGTETLQILPAAKSDAILTAPGSTNRIGVMAKDAAFSFYINGIKVTEGLDQTFTKAGKIGLFVRPNTDQGFTVGYDRLAIWNLPEPTATP